MYWCFGIINNKLAEIFFDRKDGEVKILGHTYVNETEYKTKREKQWIKDDTASYRFRYRNGRYTKVENTVR